MPPLPFPSKATLQPGRVYLSLPSLPFLSFSNHPSLYIVPSLDPAIPLDVSLPLSVPLFFSPFAPLLHSICPVRPSFSSFSALTDFLPLSSPSPLLHPFPLTFPIFPT